MSPTPRFFHCDVSLSYLNSLQRSQNSTSWPSSPVRHSTFSGSGISGSKCSESSPRTGLSGDTGKPGDSGDLGLRGGDPGGTIRLNVNLDGVPVPNGRLLTECSGREVLKAGFHWRRSRSRKSASDLVEIEKPQSRKRSHKLDGIGVGRIRTVPFSSDSTYDSDAYDPVKTRLSELQT